MPMFEPGTRVRVRQDPGRVGVITGQTMQVGGGTYWQVVFPDGAQYMSENQLECVEANDPLDLVAQGRFGRSGDLRRNLTHIRLTGRLANLIYSMDTTNTDFYAYQFKPLLKFLNSPTNGLLIADEVGLGKTIEAGLIWTELRSRIDAKRLMIICPAMLREKWKMELGERFGIKADILNATEFHNTLQEAIQFGPHYDFSVIASLQGLRPGRGWRETPQEERRTNTDHLATLLEEYAHQEPLIDLLVIEEAHYMRNRETSSADLGRLLRDVSSHVIMLSATPIHIRNTDLYQLLNLADEGTFNQQAVFSSILEANAPLVRAREVVTSNHPNLAALEEQLRSALAHPYLQDNRQLRALLADLPTEDQLSDREYRSGLAYRLETMNLLGHVISRTRKREVTEWHVIRQAVPERVELTPVEREFYDAVTELVREFCAARGGPEGFLLVMPQRQIASSMPAALQEWQERSERLASQLYEDLGIDAGEDQDMGPVTRELIERAYELSDLDTLWQNDTKLKRLIQILTGILRDNPREKIVLFSYFRATLRYLKTRLTEAGISATVLMGGAEFNRYEILDEFRSPQGPNVLLSSEVASEGIDLQFSRFLINYDLPWNPMKVEQRIGRIDRLGQPAEQIFIWNLLAKDTIDDRIYTRLYERLEIFERTLGGLESILGDEIQKLTMDLLRRPLTPGTGRGQNRTNRPGAGQ